MSHLDVDAPAAAPLLRIQQVAADVGLTTRSIRYYEELGLLKPAARSEGSYRLYDDDDVERLRFIKGLRDDAGFSLAEIGQLLEDEAARARNRQRFRSTSDPDERRAIIGDAFARVDRQIDSLREKIERLEAMVTEAEGRRAHLQAHLEEIESGAAPTPHEHARAPRREKSSR
jgi:MerR family transcriptional regulator, repressor of the yfmOP operon